MALVRGETRAADDFSLPFGRIDGRADLRGLSYAGSVGRELARTAGGHRLFGLSAVELRGVRLAGLDLRGSHLDHLKIFECVVGDEKPDPNPMLNVDLSAAQLDGVDFRKIPFDNVKLPEDPDVVLVSSVAILTNALARVAGRDDVGARVVRSRFGRMKQALESGEPQVIINVRDLRRTSPQAESLARELLGIDTR
ncbi:hypothetical protein [Asanoa iriomotensis]|uniref:hypothetical protein n=2 Tax=Asanoa iriomotensis TaxID=234613 RepID=UPI0031DDDACB